MIESEERKAVAAKLTPLSQALDPIVHDLLRLRDYEKVHIVMQTMLTIEQLRGKLLAEAVILE
jgi:hypothetical protein